MSHEEMPVAGNAPEVNPEHAENMGEEKIKWTDGDNLVRETSREEMLEHMEAKRQH